MTTNSAYFTAISMLDLYNEIEYANPPISLDDNRVRRLLRIPATPAQISLAGAYARTWGHTIEVIVVGGGGGGGAGRRDRSGGAGAGGGGGGISYRNFLVKKGNFSGSVAVGAGGPAVASEAAGGNSGGTSQLVMNSTAGPISITSSGGVGGQGGENGQRQGGNGGAGSTVSGNGIGFQGPSVYAPPGVLPITGGRGGNGLDDQPHGAQNAGGNGHQWAADLNYYGGGGGGGGDGGSPPPNGGLGGGGSGQSSGQGTPGTNGFGGGGGGGASWGNNTYNYGGNGGNGVVKIKYYNIDGTLFNIPGATGVNDGFWITHTCLSPAPITWIGPQ